MALVITQLGVQPRLAVTPASQQVEASAGTLVLNVGKTGPGPMPWTAQVTEGIEWLTITSGVAGTNEGTVALTYVANDTGEERHALIEVTARDAQARLALGSPATITIVQLKPMTLSVTPAAQAVGAAAGSASISVANEFGQVQVAVWDNPVVQVAAKISVRADSMDVAGKIARATDIQVTPSDNKRKKLRRSAFRLRHPRGPPPRPQKSRHRPSLKHLYLLGRRLPPAPALGPSRALWD